MQKRRDGYDRLVEAAIRREMSVLGDDRAVECARSVDGVTVDDDGTVRSLDRPGTAVLHDVVDAYKAASGEVAAFLIARRIENVVDPDDVDLPANLRQHV